jgi:hypothetical protein
MSPWKKAAMKAIGVEPSSTSQQTIEVEIVGTIYDDTSRLLEKDGETLKWGEVYYMFKKSKFFVEAKDPNELQEFRKIRKSGILRVATQPVVFPSAGAISCILKNIYINSRYVCNVRK